jgi:hypothetical protein
MLSSRNEDGTTVLIGQTGGFRRAPSAYPKIM